MDPCITQQVPLHFKMFTTPNSISHRPLILTDNYSGAGLSTYSEPRRPEGKHRAVGGAVGGLGPPEWPGKSDWQLPRPRAFSFESAVARIRCKHTSVPGLGLLAGDSQPRSAGVWSMLRLLKTQSHRGAFSRPADMPAFSTPQPAFATEPDAPASPELPYCCVFPPAPADWMDSEGGSASFLLAGWRS